MKGCHRLTVRVDPYYPERLFELQENGLKSWDFSSEDIKKIRHENAMKILPTIKGNIADNWTATDHNNGLALGAVEC